MALLALVPRALTTGRFETTDEVQWMYRSRSFGDALLRLDPAAASTTTSGEMTTMPGVTTMWVGTAARAVRWSGARLGLTDDAVEFTASPLGLHLAQLGVACVTSLLIGLIVLLAWRWCDPVAALTAGALLASEPFVVAHCAVLHTDAMTALFGTSGILALLLALAIPAPATGRPRVMAAFGGALLAGAFLTKVSVLALAPGFLLVIGTAMLLDARRSWHRGEPIGAMLWRRVALLVLAGGVALAVIVLAWPAIWADTVRQLGLLSMSAHLAITPHSNGTFFLGRITDKPGPLFCFVVIPLRMTPWFLLSSLVLIPIALARGKRRHAAILLVMAGSIVAVVSLAVKQMDRYVIPALPFVALALGLGLAALVGKIQSRRLVAIGLAVAALLTLHAIWIAPWGLAYFDPLLGGGTTALQATLVGWGEGLEIAGEWIRQREAPSCGVKIGLMYSNLTSAFPCGTTTNDLDAANYVALYVNHRQRLPPDALAALRQRGKLVHVVTVRGMDYVEIYDMRQPRGASHAPNAASSDAAASG